MIPYDAQDMVSYDYTPFASYGQPDLSEGDYYQLPVGPSYPDYAELIPREGEGQYFGLPPGPRDYAELIPREGEGQYFGLPPGPRDYAVSRVGPTFSARPQGPANLNVPSGSLLSRRSLFGRAQAFRPSGRYPIQRGFTVDMQEKLRRRKRGRLFG